MTEEKQLCPNCQTGIDALKLDVKSYACLYIDFHNGKSCAKYKPIGGGETKCES